MNPCRYLATSLLILFAITYSFGQRLSTDKKPMWVTANSYNLFKPELEPKAEDGYLDLVFEKQISVGERTSYFKKIIKVLSETGIQNCSEIAIDFNPAYEKLVFHEVKIIRNDKSINKLNLSKIKTIQQEKDLSSFQYNETLSAVFILDDVRKGDIIDYSYSIIGQNPVFADKFSAFFTLNYNVPLGYIYCKLIYPNSRKLNFKYFSTDLKPVIAKSGNQTSYEWKAENIAAVHLQENLPSWYDPYASIAVSEFNNWKEVNDWALTLFPEPKSISAALQQKIAEIKSNNKNLSQQISAALRFVQDDIRYFGIEVGENSHRPTDPNITFERRYGDCKDKAYLLCIMLGKLGVEANPVLINTV